MTDTLLMAILAVLLVIAWLLWKIWANLTAIYLAQTQGNAEITEALWARMGMSQKEWRERKAAAGVAELEAEWRSKNPTL